jgi:hypothetical protein
MLLGGIKVDLNDFIFSIDRIDKDFQLSIKYLFEAITYPVLL